MGTGTSDSDAEMPRPRYPPEPQHRISPSVFSAHDTYPPEATEATPEGRLATSTGARRATLVWSPTWPEELKPQHFTPPAGVTAQKLSRFPEKARTLVIPTGLTGDVRW